MRVRALTSKVFVPLPTEEDIARSHSDPAFRQQLLAQTLERLLEALNTMRKNNDKDPASARQIKEGVELAVKLADRIQKSDRNPGPKAA
jgi:hypothetical protein